MPIIKSCQLQGCQLSRFHCISLRMFACVAFETSLVHPYSTPEALCRFYEQWVTANFYDKQKSTTPLWHKLFRISTFISAIFLVLKENTVSQQNAGKIKDKMKNSGIYDLMLIRIMNAYFPNKRNNKTTRGTYEKWKIFLACGNGQWNNWNGRMHIRRPPSSFRALVFLSFCYHVDWKLVS